jgi:hypothetical protein
MSNQIHVFYSELENAENVYREYVRHKLKLIYDYEMSELITQIQEGNLDYKNFNDEISCKVRSFQQLISVRNQVKSIIETKQQLDNLSQLNEIILDSIPPNNLEFELTKPYINILVEEISSIPFFSGQKYLLIIFNPHDTDQVLKVETHEDKEIAALKICQLMVEAKNDGEIISNFKDIITPISMEFLEFIRVPIRKHIQQYNQSVLKSEIDELLQEYWDINYKVIFEITKAEKAISEDEELMKLYDNKECIIKEHSIEFHLNSDSDISGGIVNPLEENHLKKLKIELEQMVIDNLSQEYENEIIQRLIGLCENSEDLVKFGNAKFPDFDKLKSLILEMICK